MDYKDLNLEGFNIELLGKLIYNTSINFNLSLRDELVDVFINKTQKELDELDYHFTVMQQKTDSLVPCILVSSYVEDVVDVTRIFYILREYFNIKGNLRITDNPYYINSNGDVDYFERGNNVLTLLLDFTEYECNRVYTDSNFEIILKKE